MVHESILYSYEKHYRDLSVKEPIRHRKRFLAKGKSTNFGPKRMRRFCSLFPRLVPFPVSSETTY